MYDAGACFAMVFGSGSGSESGSLVRYKKLLQFFALHFYVALYQMRLCDIYCFNNKSGGDRERIARVDVVVRRDHFPDHIGKIMIMVSWNISQERE